MAEPTVNTLAIDIGGSGLKAGVLDASGAMVGDRVRVDTPHDSPPEVMVLLLARLVRDLPTSDRVSIGFPGVVRGGVVRTAPHLEHPDWNGFDLGAAMTAALSKPVRVANDADVQGLAVIRGVGIELVITLGTGFGTGLYEDGRLCPHLEISHQPFRKGETYDEQLGDAARRRVGRRKWQKRVRRAVANLRELVGFDHLFIGGGNARRLDLKLPPDVTIIDNQAGITGGMYLWQQG